MRCGVLMALFLLGISSSSTDRKTTEVCRIVKGAVEIKGVEMPDIYGWGAVAPKRGLDTAGYAEFPWMVAILDVNANESWTHSDYIAGGAIIHPTAVITAAHKVDRKKAEMIKCRTGEWNVELKIEGEFEGNEPQERLVQNLFIHPNYERLYTANDIALLFLKDKFDVSPMVRPVCIGKGAPPLGSECFATGWGRLKFDSNEYAKILKKVSAPLVPRAICWRALQAVDAARQRHQHQRTKLLLHSSLLCAGGEGEDTCTGDGGSPLVCQIQVNATHTRYAVYGLVAWGIGCGVPGSPGVYVDVAQSYYWFKEMITRRGSRILFKGGRFRNFRKKIGVK